MKRILKAYLWAVGIPALLLAAAGVRLVTLEVRHANRMAAREERRAEIEAARRERRERAAQPDPRRSAFPPRRRAAEDDPEFRRRFPPRRPFLRAFSECPSGERIAGERVMWMGGCVVGLLFLSLVSGAWLLARFARRAHEEALRKTDFLSNISHEFRTPLTSICLCAELAQDPGLSPERRAKALDAICVEAGRMKNLVESALDFSRLEKGRYVFSISKCDVAQAVRETAASMCERFAEGTLAVDCPGRIEATADAGAVRRIAAILLENAAKYAPGGAVEVRVEKRGERVAVSVADRGPGLSSGDLKKVFDRFWRGDNATTSETGGSGLGLSIAKELAKGMSAKLGVEKREGGGLVFTLELPS